MPNFARWYWEKLQIRKPRFEVWYETSLRYRELYGGRTVNFITLCESIQTRRISFCCNPWEPFERKKSTIRRDYNDSTISHNADNAFGIDSFEIKCREKKRLRAVRLFM